MTLVRRRVVVDGRVQGVFFRETCRREAAAAGVAGWVANRSDGKVEAVFEGPVEAVDRLVEWCRRGPRSARVADVTVRDETPRGDRDFRVVDAGY
ncbi:MAG: acylphosphatase [Actinobacteria bacterium]|nr:acylphosphatase [Actinomycetota bacterium]